MEEMVVVCGQRWVGGKQGIKGNSETSSKSAAEREVEVSIFFRSNMVM